MADNKKLSISDYFTIAFALAIVAVIGFGVIQPNAEFFRGSAVNVPEKEDTTASEKEASLVVKYLKSGQEINAFVGQNVNIGSYGLIVGNKEIELTSLSFALIGSEQKTFDNFSLIYEGEVLEDAEFEWLADGTLLVHLIDPPVKIKPNSKTDFVTLDLNADIVHANGGTTALFHFVDATFSANVSSIGIIDSGTEPVPQIIKIN